MTDFRLSRRLLLGLALGLASAPAARAHDDLTHAHAFADAAFQRHWSRADQPVADGVVRRTWLWGPYPVTDGLSEAYLEAVGGGRLVQYFDKSRMELTRRPGTPVVAVTNGLLVVELVTGRRQLGDDLFVQRDPSTALVAGDQRPYPGSPTYAALARVLDAPALAPGAEITQTIDADGRVAGGGPGGVYVASVARETGHSIADIFWRGITAEGPVATDEGLAIERLSEPPLAATGYPITEPYWAVVLVNGRPARVLLQAFQRRVLTYTPTNTAGFQVEAGNVGRHYYAWRYGPR
jgi:hypothetical protein